MPVSRQCFGGEGAAERDFKTGSWGFSYVEPKKAKGRRT